MVAVEPAAIPTPHSALAAGGPIDVQVTGRGRGLPRRQSTRRGCLRRRHADRGALRPRRRLPHRRRPPPAVGTQLPRDGSAQRASTAVTASGRSFHASVRGRIAELIAASGRGALRRPRGHREGAQHRAAPGRERTGSPRSLSAPALRRPQRLYTGRAPMSPGRPGREETPPIPVGDPSRDWRLTRAGLPQRLPRPAGRRSRGRLRPAVCLVGRAGPGRGAPPARRRPGRAGRWRRRRWWCARCR